MLILMQGQVVQLVSRFLFASMKTQIFNEHQELADHLLRLADVVVELADCRL